MVTVRVDGHSQNQVNGLSPASKPSAFNLFWVARTLSDADTELNESVTKRRNATNLLYI